MRGSDGPVVLDAMGGDQEQAELVAGAVAAVRQHGAQIILAGHAEPLLDLLRRHGAGHQGRGGARPGRHPDGRQRGGAAVPAGHQRRRGLRSAGQRPRRGDGVGRIHRWHRGHRAGQAGLRARGRPASHRRAAAGPPAPGRAAGRRGHHRPDTGDARPVRRARRGLRGHRARHRVTYRRPAHHRLGARQGEPAGPPGAAAAGRRAGEVHRQRGGAGPADRRRGRGRHGRLHRQRHAQDDRGHPAAGSDRDPGRGPR